MARAKIIEMAGEATLYSDSEARELRGALAQYVRISIGTMPQNEALVKTVAEMLRDRKRR